MTESFSDFGRLPNGEAVERVQIAHGGLSANILTYGALVQDLRIEGHPLPLVLGFSTLEDYLAHSPYFGATPGRFSNRIAHGRFELDGLVHQLDLNQNGEHHLHGGSKGFGKRNWQITERSDRSVRLELESADGDMGYPGKCRAVTIYEISDGGVLSVRHETTADAPTIANLTHHSYFNLDGRDTILDHELMLAADAYLPTGQGQIPTGAVTDVEGTPFDFRDMRAIRHALNGAQVDYDHNFCLSREPMPKRTVGLLRSLYSGIALELRTTEPGVQFYCGFKINTPRGLTGVPYGPYSGLCLEAQIWPDAPNQPAFPNSILRPGEVRVQETDYVFTRS